ncbi:uncharacterized protein J3R85_004169 [Psidium guajava]|nr:uncharacterized protein J3R85_004169 [Psidium guajava]
MKNTIRCCISCILPCGALDVDSGSCTLTAASRRSAARSRAGEIMKLHPKHVLKKPSSSRSDDGVVPRIVIVPPDAELQRGKIYFLMPVPSMPEKTRSRSSSRKEQEREPEAGGGGDSKSAISMTANLLISDRYLTEILSEKLSTQRDRRRGPRCRGGGLT